MSLFQRSTLTFGNAKTYVAQKAGGKDSAVQLARAGRSIQAAIQHWNKAANWSWLLMGATTIAMTTANSGDLPYDFKDAYDVRWLGSNPRTLDNVSRKQYDRNIWNQEPGKPRAYDLYSLGNSGTISLLPAPSQSGSISLRYYRKMTVPCTVSAVLSGEYPNRYVAADSLAGVYPGNRIISSATAFITQQTITAVTTPTYAVIDNPVNATVDEEAVVIGGDDQFLDIPADYEWHILAWAVHHFMSDMGAPPDRLSYWMQYSEQGLQQALNENNRMPEDMDLAFLPPSPHETKFIGSRVVNLYGGF